MKESQPNFQQASPAKVLNNAIKFSKTYDKFYSTPSSPQKKSDVAQLAIYKRERVQAAIETVKFQHQLFKQLENKDHETRRKYRTHLDTSLKKIEENIHKREDKEQKKAQKYNKQLKKVYDKFKEDQKFIKNRKDQQAVELRKQLLKFYEKEKKRKQKADHDQVKVGGCYQSAIARIKNQHLRNQQFSRKAQRQVYEDLANKNNLHKIIIHGKIKDLSLCNKKKQEVYERFEDILQNKHEGFIQTYGQDMDGSIKAFMHKSAEKQKVNKRLEQFFKKRVEKWEDLKKRVDQENEEVPEKCLNILEKTTKASFRQTFSSFRSSAKEWNTRVTRNKSNIRQSDQMKKDQIMSIHLDLRLKNNASFKISQKMETMRGQAKKLAEDYL